MTDSEKLLLVLLGVGGIFLVSKTSDKTVAAVKKAREKDIESGISKPFAKELNPTPKEKKTRQFLLHQLLEEARRRYISCFQNERQDGRCRKEGQRKRH